jgi:hypothetical protein
MDKMVLYDGFFSGTAKKATFQTFYTFCAFCVHFENIGNVFGVLFWQAGTDCFNPIK